MFTIQTFAQQGLKFAGHLFKDRKKIGGIGNDSEGIYVNLRENLNVSEMIKLMDFIKSLNPDFEGFTFTLSYLDD